MLQPQTPGFQVTEPKQLLSAVQCREDMGGVCQRRLHWDVTAARTCTPVSSVMLYLSACSVPQRPPASKRSHLRTPGTLRFVRSMRSRNGALHSNLTLCYTFPWEIGAQQCSLQRLRCHTAHSSKLPSALPSVYALWLLGSNHGYASGCKLPRHALLAQHLKKAASRSVLRLALIRTRPGAPMLLLLATRGVVFRDIAVPPQGLGRHGVPPCGASHHLPCVR